MVCFLYAITTNKRVISSQTTKLQLCVVCDLDLQCFQIWVRQLQNLRINPVLTAIHNFRKIKLNFFCLSFGLRTTWVSSTQIIGKYLLTR